MLLLRLVYQGNIYCVEEFPNTPLTEDILPYDVAIEMNDYTGDSLNIDSPNVDKSVLYLD